MLNKQKPNIIQQSDDYGQMRKDLTRVLILNGTLFALLLALYFWNRSSGALDQIFGKFLNF